MVVQSELAECLISPACSEQELQRQLHRARAADLIQRIEAARLATASIQRGTQGCWILTLTSAVTRHVETSDAPSICVDCPN